MKTDATRRGFIGGASAFCTLASGCILGTCPAKRWYKGNLHMHSCWSDGQAFPEEAVEWYRKRGYNFIGLSDHNVFQDDGNRWVGLADPEKNVRGVAQKVAQRYLKDYPDCETRKSADGRTEFRLKTFDELSRRYNVPGEFLMVPAVEATRTSIMSSGHKHQLHMNYVGLAELLPSYASKTFKRTLEDKDLSEFLRETRAEVDELARKRGKPHMFMLNHPIWTWYDVGPEVLIDNPEVKFFELCNNGSPFAPGEGLPGDGFDTDRFWDVVNAFRVRRGQGLLYGVGTDDTHYYNGEKTQMCMAGNAWSLVRADSLSAEALISAMHEGDFVTCEMLEIDDVQFDHAAGRLDVSVPAGKATARTVKFIVTKKDFSEKPVGTVTVRPEKHKDKTLFERTISIYDEKIGLVAKTVKGAPGEAIKASYTLQDDDLYVRARIEESGQPLCTAHLHPQGMHVAWTQPYVAAK